MRIFLALCLVGALMPNLTAQPIGQGLPFITNYTPKEYGAEAQNWSFAQSENGLLYVGNSGGVLEFDGRSWRLIRLTDNSACLALARGHGDVIYVGGQAQLGRLTLDSLGFLAYESLVELLPSTVGEIKDVRRIVNIGSLTYFIISDPSIILRFDGHVFEIVDFPEAIGQFAFNAQDHLYVMGVETGLAKLMDSGFETIPGTKGLSQNGQISMVMSAAKGLVVGTWHDGLYTIGEGGVSPAPSSLNEYLKSNLFYSSQPLNDRNLLLGTISDGAVLVDSDLEVLTKFTKETGIIDNTILSAYQDHEGNLWLGTNNGISYIEYASPFRRFPKEWGYDGNIQTIARFQGALHVGTSQGIFKFVDIASERLIQGALPSFQKQEYGDVDCFALMTTEAGLLAGSYQEILLVDDDGPRQVSPGEVNRFAASHSNPDWVFAGLRDGVGILELRNGRYEMARRLPGIETEVRSIVEDNDGSLWLGTFYEGVLHVDLETNDVERLGIDDGLPSLRNNEVFWLFDQLYVATMEGLHHFNSELNRFESVQGFPEDFRREWIYRMAPYSSSSFFAHFFDQGETVLAERTDSEEVVVNNRLSRLDDFSVYAIHSDQEGTWFGGPDGLVRMMPMASTDRSEAPSTLVRSVWFKDSLLSSHVFSEEKPSFDYTQNAFRFESTTTSYVLPGSREFRYWLSGYEEEWSGWTEDPTRVYTNLDPGEYVFQVASQDGTGRTGTVATFPFSIQTPWFRSFWFTALYISISLGILGYVVRYFSRRKLIRRVEALELEQKVVAERDRISSDLHDHVGAQLTSIISGLNVTEKFLPPSETSQMKEIIDSLKEDAQTTIMNLRDTIWTLKFDNIDLGEFAGRVEEVVSNLVKYSNELQATVVVNGDSGIPLSQSVALNLLRIIEESIHNSIKHSGAKEVVVTLEGGAGSVRVICNDNGVGFDISGESMSGHYGISNMRKRAVECGGAFDIVSNGGGTTISVDLPKTS